MRRFRCAAVIALLFTAGCQLGPEAMKVGHEQYSSAIRQLRNEELLLNLVRLRYTDIPVFLQITSVSLSYLHLRPAILDQLKKELPTTEFNVLHSCFERKPWTKVGAATRSKLIPRALRKKGYGRFRELARKFGIQPLICQCKNPDLPGQLCSASFANEKTGKHLKEKGKQLTLFPC